LNLTGGAEFGHVSAVHTTLMVLSGLFTAVPLLLFAGAANRVPLVGLGILQYVAPILQFACGVLIFHEPMPAARLAGFALVWIALIIFTVDGLRRASRARTESRAGRAGIESPASRAGIESPASRAGIESPAERAQAVQPTAALPPR
jgi:chloramphenicol-sensitive protein RarD